MRGWRGALAGGRAMHAVGARNCTARDAVRELPPLTPPAQRTAGSDSSVSVGGRAAVARRARRAREPVRRGFTVGALRVGEAVRTRSVGVGDGRARCARGSTTSRPWNARPRPHDRAHTMSAHHPRRGIAFAPASSFTGLVGDRGPTARADNGHGRPRRAPPSSARPNRDHNNDLAALDPLAAPDPRLRLPASRPGARFASASRAEVGSVAAAGDAGRRQHATVGLARPLRRRAPGWGTHLNERPRTRRPG